MPYTPPSGWVEQVLTVPGSMLHAPRFHIRRDCPAIGQQAVLSASDKPYSATRCRTCTNDAP